MRLQFAFFIALGFSCFPIMAAAQVVPNGTFDDPAFGSGQNGHGGDPFYFSSDLNYTPPVPGGNTTDTQYTIATSAYPWHPQQPIIQSYGDHTTGLGRYFICNNPLIPNQNIWAVSIDGFQIGGTYTFEGFTSNWSGGPSSRDVLTINDVVQGDILSAFPSIDTWYEFSRTFVATSTSVTFAIKNQSTQAGGNDSAFDDFRITGDLVPEPSSFLPVLIGIPMLLRKRKESK